MFPVTPHCQEQGSFATYLDKEEDEFVPLWESKEEGVAVVVVVVTVVVAVVVMRRLNTCFPKCEFMLSNCSVSGSRSLHN